MKSPLLAFVLRSPRPLMEACDDALSIEIEWHLYGSSVCSWIAGDPEHGSPSQLEKVTACAPSIVARTSRVIIIAAYVVVECDELEFCERHKFGQEMAKRRQVGFLEPRYVCATTCNGDISGCLYANTRAC
jgi:hypothetical protein